MDTGGKKTRYSYRFRRKLPYRTRVKLKLKSLRLNLGQLLRIPLKRSKRKSFFSFKYILPIFISILAVVFLTLTLIGVKKTTGTDEVKPLKPLKKITVNYGTKIYEVTMRSGTMKDVLEKADLVIKPEYDIIPGLYTGIDMFSECWVIIIESKSVVKTVAIDYQVIEQIDESFEKGQRQIVTKGENGEVKLFIEQIYKNGFLYSQRLIDRQVMKQPVDEVIKTASE